MLIVRLDNPFKTEQNGTQVQKLLEVQEQLISFLTIRTKNEIVSFLDRWRQSSTLLINIAWSSKLGTDFYRDSVIINSPNFFFLQEIGSFSTKFGTVFVRSLLDCSKFPDTFSTHEIDDSQKKFFWQVKRLKFQQKIQFLHQLKFISNDTYGSDSYRKSISSTRSKNATRTK